MEDAIARKLRNAMAEPFDTEAKVVYALCETRKLLAKDGAMASYPALRLYCHWALHVDLHGEHTTMDLLRRTDAAVEAKLEGPETNDTIVAEHNLFRDFVYLETLRREMEGYLATKRVAAMVCQDDYRWFEFVAHLAGVVEDGSISCHSDANSTLKWIDKMVFAKGREHPKGDTCLPFDMYWKVAFKPGARFKGVDINVSSDKQRKFLVWGYSIVR